MISSAWRDVSARSGAPIDGAAGSPFADRSRWFSSDELRHRLGDLVQELVDVAHPVATEPRDAELLGLDVGGRHRRGRRRHAGEVLRVGRVLVLLPHRILPRLGHRQIALWSTKMITNATITDRSSGPGRRHDPPERLQHRLRDIEHQLEDRADRPGRGRTPPAELDPAHDHPGQQDDPVDREREAEQPDEGVRRADHRLGRLAGALPADEAANEPRRAPVRTGCRTRRPRSARAPPPRPRRCRG